MLGATGALLIVAVTAAAYFVAGSGGSGSGSSKLGGAEGVELTYEVSFREGLKPGEEAPIKITTTNTTAHATEIGAWEIGVSIEGGPAKEGCEPSWFEIVLKTAEKSQWAEMLELGKTLPIEPAENVMISSAEAGGFGQWGGEYYLKFKEEPVNQNACEFATATVTAKSKT